MMSVNQQVERRALFIIVTAFALASGCAKLPEEETQAAHAALAKARQADAATYAPDALQQAEDANSRLDAELKAQERRFALTRSYKDAVRLAGEAQKAAEKAATDAVAGKEEARGIAETRIAEARTALAEAKTNLASAPAGKGTQMDIDALRSDLTAIEGAIADAERAYQEGRFQQARIAAEAAKASALKVQEDVQSARSIKRST